MFKKNKGKQAEEDAFGEFKDFWISSDFKMQKLQNVYPISNLPMQVVEMQTLEIV